MEIQADFVALLESFNARGVDYVIVGGFALGFHGAPRYTGDLDVLVAIGPANASRVLLALQDFGFGSLGLTEADFAQPDNVIQLGVPPVRIDIVTSISGVTWEEARRGRVAGSFGDVPVHFLGRAEFIRNKRACGRAKDLADVEALGEDV